MIWDAVGAPRPQEAIVGWAMLNHEHACHVQTAFLNKQELRIVCGVF